MALMELHRQNRLNTTTMVTTTSNNGAGTFAYAFDRNLRLAFSTVGYTGSTVSAISVVFSSTTPVSHLMIQNHNLRQFRAYYNSTTASALGSAVSGNSVTSTYISFSTVQASSVDIELEGAMTSGSEQFIGELVIGDRLLVFERNPSVNDWTPDIRRKQIVHEMPDGGVKVFNIRDKFSAKLKWHFVTEDFHDDLYALWSSANSMYFVPFPTTTGWSGVAHEVSWLGDFDFKHEDNSKSQGFIGSILLRETAGG